MATKVYQPSNKVQLNWVNRLKDKLGIFYNNLMATTGLLSIGVKFQANSTNVSYIKARGHDTFCHVMSLDWT